MRLWSRPLIVAGMGVVPQGPEEGPAAVPAGGGRAWPGFETTRRAKLAARTARGRAAAHGHTKQPGPAGARNTRGATATGAAPTRPGIQKPTSGSDVGLRWS